MMSRRPDSATVKVLNAVRDGLLKPVCSQEIIEEYDDVLSRDKFRFLPEDIRLVVNSIVSKALFLEPESSSESFSDESDRVFYEVALAAHNQDARLVTGNVRHFPISPIVVTPAQMVAIIEERCHCPPAS